MPFSYHSDCNIRRILSAGATSNRIVQRVESLAWWVPNKIGGPQAPDNFHEGYRTQVWLAVSEDAAALVSDEYSYHQKWTSTVTA